MRVPSLGPARLEAIFENKLPWFYGVFFVHFGFLQAKLTSMLAKWKRVGLLFTIKLHGLLGVNFA